MLFFRRPQPGQTWEASRLLSLADAIFAIAMTLLTLNLAVPEGLTATELRVQLLGMDRDLLHYFLSFFVLSRYWLAHVTRFSHIVRVDRTFVVFNLLTLSFVAIVPSFTAMSADYVNSNMAVMLYTGLLGLIGLSDNLAWRHVARRRPNLLSTAVTPDMAKRWAHADLVGPGVALASFALAAFHPEAALWLLGIGFIAFSILRNRLYGEEPAHGTTSDGAEANE